METPIAEEVALLNSCLRAIPKGGIDFVGIANATGMRHGDVSLALDVMEADGVIYSFGKTRKIYGRQPRPGSTLHDLIPHDVPWCEQCDCYHYTTAPCIDEIAYCKRCGEYHTHPVCAIGVSQTSPA